MAKEMQGMEVTVVGLCGKARSGKDTAARMLAGHLTNSVGSVHIKSMASTMKGMLLQLFESAAPPGENPMTHCLACIQGELKEEEHPLLGKSPRQLMQTLGTEWGRGTVREDVWIRVMENKIQREAFDAKQNGEEGQLVVIIPDIRYNNEAALCDVIVKITREDAPEVSAHTSEAGLDPELVSYTVSNDESLEALDKKMSAIAYVIVNGAHPNDRSQLHAA